MDTQWYKVEVLHYLNPHLIWIEVTDPAFSENGEYVFEQVGIHGILPLESTLDEIEESLITQRGQWMPAATLAMRDAFADAEGVFFLPTNIDRRTSIFDNNVHKYGDFITLSDSGKKRRLSKILIKSGYAVKDECAFYKELCSGNLNTKLSPAITNNVIAQIEKQYQKKNCSTKEWEKSLKKHTMVHKEIQNLESQLTETNLKVLAEDPKKKINVESLLQKKSKDFEICKGIDEESAGRAVHRTKNVKDLNMSLLQKKLEKVYQASEASSIFEMTKKFLVKNAVAKDISENDAVINKPNTSPPNKNGEDINTSFKYDNAQENMLPNERVDDEYVKPKKTKKASKNRKKIPEYDTRTQMRVAFGPPEADQSLLTLKVIPIEDDPIPTPIADVEESPNTKESHGDKVSYNDFNSSEVYNSNVETLNPKLNTKSDNSEIKLISDCNNLVLKSVNAKFDLDDTATTEIKNDTKDVVDSINASQTKVNNHYQKHMDLKLQSKSNDIVKKAKEIVVKQKYTSPNNSKEVSPNSSILKRKLRLHKENENKLDFSGTSNSDTSVKDSSTSVEESKPKKKGLDLTDTQSDDDKIDEIIKKIDSEYSRPVPNTKEIIDTNIAKKETKHNPNPFKNIDSNLSVFVDKLVSPILMVHAKKNNRIQPSFKISDMHFTHQILGGLKILKIEWPQILQTISWLTILRGYSLFMISPKGSGKTIGYLPAICRLISDSNNEIYSVGPICIIVCATAYSVTEVDHLARLFLRENVRILACYSGMSELDLATSILNGCELLICTPSVLVRLLTFSDFGVDLRRLQTFVLDDCERLGQVYVNEIKFFFHKIKEMLKKRVVKELKVQVILASRVWCDFMTPLAKKSPDTVISIGAFQECVLYSKASMQATFVAKEKKIDSVLKFLNQADRSRKTVIACRTDDEVDVVQNALNKLKYLVFSANNKMTVHDLYTLSLAWEECEERVSGPVLVCCDGNLEHINVTDAHYLVHYSLPELYSMFVKRFSVLNDNYPSIFTDDNENVKIKILLDEENTEQLPKILHFIQRCTKEVPTSLDELCEKVLEQKDLLRAKKMVPICDSLLTLGECPDFWSCQERHTIIKEYDEPRNWMPTQGVVTFKISYYHTAVFYSARLLSNTCKGDTTKYPQNYNKMLMKIATYFAKESNRMSHGTPKLGDIAAVALKQNLFARCQVVNILSLDKNGKPDYVLVRLIDEERLEKIKDIYLFHLPDAMKEINTYVVQVRLAYIQPKDKDITFSDLARDALINITDNDDIFMRGKIKLAVGNCLIVDNIEACRDLSSMNKVVVRANFKQILEAHSTENPEHVPKLEKLCQDGGMTLIKNINDKNVIAKKPLPKSRWAHLEKDDLSCILFASAESPGNFFVRLVKFEQCLYQLIQDIQKHMADKPEYTTHFEKGDIVLAKFPDDGMYERARIDEMYDGKVKCFFVDHGDWRDVQDKRIAQITEKLITQLPFQAIECRLVGVLPAGEIWTEFATVWFTNFFEDNNGHLKQMYIKYFTKEKSLYTEGHKYGVAVVDTNDNQDLVVNRMIIEVNIGRENENEIGFLDNLNFEKVTNESTDSSDDWEQIDNTVDLLNETQLSLDNIFLKKPIRSVPLVDSDGIEDDTFDVNMIDDFLKITNLNPKNKLNKLLEIENDKTIDTMEIVQEDNIESIRNAKKNKEVVELNSDATSNYSSSAIEVIPSPKLNALDSDDLTSSVSSELTETSPVIVVNETLKQTALNSIANIERVTRKPDTVIEKDEDELRKPKLCWRQNCDHVIIKIMLIGVEDYKLDMQERHLKFEAETNSTKYGFDVDIYGVINVKESGHSNKGQYILVTLKKILKRNWLNLTRNGIKRWIVYDVDHIDDSSSEDDEYCTPASVFKHTLKKSDSESDDEFMDDISFKYKRYD